MISEKLFVYHVRYEVNIHSGYYERSDPCRRTKLDKIVLTIIVWSIFHVSKTLKKLYEIVCVYW